MKKDELGMRMKENYENRAKTSLIRRMPVAIRIDGKAFHTFTRGMQKPFDEILMHTMQNTLLYLCENIQGCVFGYTQSDEITLILVDYKTLTSDAWFDYKVQKLCSVSASMATMAFNKFFAKNVQNEIADYVLESNEPGILQDMKAYFTTLKNAMEKGAMFDARCFNIPKEEVVNLVYWRQQDAIRNSVQMCGQAYFSQSELQGKNQQDIKNMLKEANIMDWDTLSPDLQHGVACRELTDEEISASSYKSSSKWIIDNAMPVLLGEDRAYLEKLIDF